MTEAEYRSTNGDISSPVSFSITTAAVSASTRSLPYRLHRWFVLLLFSIGTIVNLAAQIADEPQGGLQPRFQTQAVTYEAVALFGEDTSRAVVNIHYRLWQNFFIFIRNDAESRTAEYAARGELLIELLDEERNSVARQIKQISLARTTLPKESEVLPDIQGAMTFTVPKGTYQIVFSLDDRESGRSFLERTRRITARKPNLTALEMSPPLLLQPNVHPGEQAFTPINRGGDVLFGGRGSIVSQMYLGSGDDALDVQWKLEGQVDGSKGRTQVFAGSMYAMVNGLLSIAGNQEGIQYRVQPSPLAWRTVSLPIPFEKLEPGSFKLDVEYRAGGKTQTQTHRFRVVWPQRPYSLFNATLALEALRHIASEEEMDGILSSSGLRQAEAFSRFWRQKDPDTTTAYNEVLTEYYLRVDEALRRFSGVREGDGFKTDRGRIYILYGPPSETNRVFQPGGPPTEIWVYSQLNRRFVFIDPSRSGAYILSKAEDL
jgi:GWxTD domain-containing protein